MRRYQNVFVLCVLMCVLVVPTAKAEAPAAIAAVKAPSLTFLKKYGDGTKEPVDPEVKHRWFFSVLTRMEDTRAQIEREAVALESRTTRATLKDPVQRGNGQGQVKSLLLRLKTLLDDNEEAQLWVNGFREKPGYTNIRSYHSLLAENILSTAQKLDALRRQYFPLKRS